MKAKSKKSKITKEEFREELLKILEFQKYILNLIEKAIGGFVTEPFKRLEDNFMNKVEQRTYLKDMKEFTRVTGLKSVPYDENQFIDIVKIQALINSIKIKRIKFNK